MINPNKISVLNRYLEPHRFYHGINHVMELFMLFNHAAYVDGLPRPARSIENMVKGLEYQWRFNAHSLINDAILFHDAVYDPSRKDNEEKSAVLTHRYVSDDDGYGDELRKYILATKHHTVEDSMRESNLALFLSLDLSGLASSEENFNKNSDDILKEYLPYFSKGEILSGRAKFFQSYLERPYIFPHIELEQAWGDKARKNIEQGIKLCLQNL